MAQPCGTGSASITNQEKHKEKVSSPTSHALHSPPRAANSQTKKNKKGSS